MLCMGDTEIPMAGCKEGEGFYDHVFEDIDLVEHLDMETNEPISDEERGDWVVTPLHYEAVPHIRWKMEDYTTIYYDKCTCGTTHARLRFFGRMGDLIIVRGKKILTPIVENILFRTPEVRTHAMTCQMIKTDPKSQDTLPVRTAYEIESVKDTEGLKAKIEEVLKKELNVPVNVELLSPEEVDKSKIAGWKFLRVLKKY